MLDNKVLLVHGAIKNYIQCLFPDLKICSFININTTTTGANIVLNNNNNNNMSGLTITFTSANPEVTVNGTKINTLTCTSIVSGINVRYSS